MKVMCVVLVAMVGASAVCSADETLWKPAVDDASAHRAKGAYDKAESILVDAVAAAESQSDWLSVTVLTSHLGTLYEEMGRNQQAETQLLKTVELLERVKGKEELIRTFRVRALNNIASLYVETQQERKGESLNLEKWAGTSLNDADNARLWNNLACINVARGRKKEAERYLRQALTAWRKSPEQTGEGAMIAGNLGVLKLGKGEYQEALTYLSEAVRELEGHYERWPRLMVKALANLASVHFAMGRKQESLELFERSADMAEQRLEAGDPLTNEIQLTLVSAMRQAGRKKEASQFAKRAGVTDRGLAPQSLVRHTVDVSELLQERRK